MSARLSQSDMLLTDDETNSRLQHECSVDLSYLLIEFALVLLAMRYSPPQLVVKITTESFLSNMNKV